MAKNLGVYGSLTEVKVKEKEVLVKQIKDMKFAIKSTKKNTKEMKKNEEDYNREVVKLQKVIDRKREERFFMQKEMQEIRELIP